MAARIRDRRHDGGVGREREQGPVAGAVPRGGGDQPVHRVRRLRDGLPSGRAGVRPHRDLPPVQRRALDRGRRLRPRPARLRHLHQGLPALPGLGGRVRPGPVRAGQGARGGHRDPPGGVPGQGGGLVSALLVWGLETGRIEGALTSRLSPVRRWDGEPFLATTRGEVLEAAGSRYTYAANPLAMKEAERRGLRRLALVGMSCQASINGTLQARRVNKYARRIEITLGLLCSKSFGYDGLRQVIVEGYGVPLDDIAKVNIKGQFQLWRRSTGEQVEIPLKQLQQATREGCKLCPDFAAEHADIATGGLGQRDGWTLAVVRTQRGEDWMR